MPVFLGFLGVLAFSFTLPATRVAVEELDPVFVGIGREALAAVLAGGDPDRPRERRCPTRPQLKSLAIVASGVVFGWPLFSALALQGLTSAHSAVIVGLLPAATAVAAVLRAGEHPTRGFWVASLAGLASVLVFAATQGAGVSWGDIQILVAVALGAIGYAEGGALAREMGGWRVICWAVLLSRAADLPDRCDRRDRLGSARERRRVARVRIRHRDQRPDRLLPLVRRARARRRGEDRPDPADPASAHARVVRAAPRRAHRSGHDRRILRGTCERCGHAAEPG